MSTSAPTRYQRQRFYLAALSAPLTFPALALFVQTFLSDFNPHRGPNLDHLEKFLGGTLLVIVVGSYLATLAIGMPLLALLKHWHLRTMATVTGAAAMAGLALGLGSAAIVWMNQPQSKFPWFFAILGTVMAMLHGAVFSSVAGFPPVYRSAIGAFPIAKWRDAPLSQRVAMGTILVSACTFLILTVAATFVIPASG